METPGMGRSLNSLFDDEDRGGRMTGTPADSLFDNHGAGASVPSSPWDINFMSTPRRQLPHAELVQSLLAGAEIPDSYVEAFEHVVRQDSTPGGRVSAAGITKTLAGSGLRADEQARVRSLVAGVGAGFEEADGREELGRDGFFVLLALIGLAREGETVSLDGVEERRANLPELRLPNILTNTATTIPKPIFPVASDLASKPPQVPVTARTSSSPRSQERKASMADLQEDPWNTPDLHRNHGHVEPRRSDSYSNGASTSPVKGRSKSVEAGPSLQDRTTPTTSSAVQSTARPVRQPAVATGGDGGWSNSFFDGADADNDANSAGPVNAPRTTSWNGRVPVRPSSTAPHARALGSSRAGSAVEDRVSVSLLPEKEGLFLFQHHNYEVASVRRGSKVIRRYSDFVWLLDCLHKRYPFRVLPQLPPKRVAVNGNHLSNDGAFIDKRRRGLGRFLNAVLRHPVLKEEQLVVMFLTVPTELSVWRKQATISVQDEFTGRSLTPEVERDNPDGPLNQLFTRTRAGIRRSADLYINACNLMDRLVKRSEGVAADHGRMAMSLASLTETNDDAYATDPVEVPLLNDGLVAMSKGLSNAQLLLEDESKAWEVGVLEDLKTQRDALVSVRDMFERRDRLDKDNIPYLEKRISINEAKLAALRDKPDELRKPGEIERVVESLVKDKESIVEQRNRSVFVRECIKDELKTFQRTQYHLSRLSQDWAQERVKYSEMLADNWRSLVEQLEGMPLGD